jgi:predicted PolB exonuclease-like 3'-5' exonuclease
LVFDIETVADGRLVQRIRYPEAPELSPQEAVARYRAQLMEQNGTDFIPGTFQVPVSVAVAKVGHDHFLQGLVTLDRPAFRPQIIVEKFWRGWEAYGQPTLVTFNGRGFDLPVMEMGAYRYGIPIPAWLKLGAKAWEDPRNRFHGSAHMDLQEVLSNFGAFRINGGLNLCASLLGKPGKMDTKGDMVQDLWQAGEGIRIDDYCRCDALDTYFVFLRVRVLTGHLDLEGERERVLAARELVSALADAGDEAMAAYLERFELWQAPGAEGSPFLPEPG